MAPDNRRHSKQLEEVEKGLINEKLTFIAGDKGSLQTVCPIGLAHQYWS